MQPFSHLIQTAISHFYLNPFLLIYVYKLDQITFLYFWESHRITKISLWILHGFRLLIFEGPGLFRHAFNKLRAYNQVSIMYQAKGT